jgi:transposase
VIINYKNNNITPIAEKIILLNNKKKVKDIKKELQKVNIKLNSKAILFIINNKKENITTTEEETKINENVNINLTEENEKFIEEISDKKTKEIADDFEKKFFVKISEKQIVNVLYKKRKKVTSFYKKTDILVEFIINKIKEKSIYTISDIKDIIHKEFKLKVSTQLIYNILKEKNYVYKRIKRVNNPYTIEEQIKQFEKVKEKHNLKNIENCVSLDEMSVVINSKPNYGWFEKNKEGNYKIENPKITNKRYTILMAVNNKKILNYTVCEQGIKTDGFIKFMDELKEKDKNKNSYYLMDNAVVHKTKKFNEYVLKNKLNIVYNAPYHSESNPIENVFSIYRNKINRKDNSTIEKIKSITEEFIKEDNEEKIKNIFDHSVKTIENFINENKK